MKTQDLINLVLRYDCELTKPDSVHPFKLLWAICGAESSFGENSKYRIEKSYMPGGRYHNAILYEKYGENAAASCGAWQVMFPVAWELGFRGSPGELAEPENNLKIAIKYLNIRARGAQTVEQFADAYNSGNYRDDKIPLQYIRRVLHYYAKINMEDILCQEK